MTENIQDIYPLSPMQQGMLFHSIYAPETEVYTEQLSCELHGFLDTNAFYEAWKKVVSRHDTLRTAFVWENLDEPLQVVHKSVEIPYEIQDWTDKSSSERSDAFSKLCEAERKRGLELTEAPLIRLILIKRSEDSWYFIWNYHHLLIDGWGMPLILKEVFVYYESTLKNQTVSMPLPRPYKDYIAWLQEQDLDKAKVFWSERLKGFTEPTPLTVEKRHPGNQNGYAKERYIFPQKITEGLNALTKEYKITLNTIVQGAWAFLLSRYSRMDHVVFGATVSGRPPEIPGVETILGLFINTLPVHIRLSGEQTVLEWLQEIQIQQAETREYEYTPLVEIQKWSAVPNDQPLFKSIIVFENYPVGEALSDQQESSLSISGLRSFERTNFPLTVVAAPGASLAIDIAYETDTFEHDTIQQIFKHLENIFHSFIDQPREKLANIALLTPAEKQTILTDWNTRTLDIPQDTMLSAVFEEQVLRTPEHTAIRYENQEFSFAELNSEANKLAHFLIQLGIGPESIIGILLDRSINMVIAALAVLKAGGAYVPIDPEYPLDRINYMIQDSDLSLLITHSKLSDRYEEGSFSVVDLDSDRHRIDLSDDTNPKVKVFPEDIAYIIYTSGSTGRPKGVLLHQQGAVNFFMNMIRDFHLEPGKSVLQLASFSFDAATADIFATLLSGSTLQLVKKETLLSTNELIQLCNEKKVTTAMIPPSLLSILPEDAINSFETIVSVGDACTLELANRWNKKCRFMNGYGPTEGTIGAVWGVVEDKAYDSLTAPIGKPLANVKIYIIDSYLHPVPIGVPGEIHISGPGVARGYLNRPDLTAEKFIPDPFSTTAGARMYKTGDLARWLPDGQIEFIGRVDFQVKIRGFRIELGEIEAELSKQSSVKDVVVIARGEKAGEKMVVAYLIPQDGETPVPDDLRTALKERLPEYMVPAAFVVLDAFPLTPNGKVNRKALPAPDAADLSGSEFVAARTPEEELLASIWADVLSLEEVSVESSFFDLGGHSLLATQVISRIQDAFDVELHLRDLFETPTIARIAEKIDQIKKGEAGIAAPPIEPVDRNQDLPLSFAQQRLWFLDQLQPNSTAYNIPSALKLLGTLNVQALEASIQEIIARHESFRTTFDDDNGKPKQIIHTDSDFELDVIDLSVLSKDDRENELNRLAQKEAQVVFNLSTGPLFRAVLVKLQDEEHAILFNMHHIISDGWSIGVLIREMVQLYAAFSEGKPSPLPDLEIQYPDFAYWQQHWLQGDVLENQIRYWKEQLSGAPPLLELPTDRPRPAVQTANGASARIEINEDLTGDLKQLSREEGVTVFMTLLAAFHTLLHRYSGQNEVLIGSPIANRTNSKVEKLIGFFVNTLIFKGDLSDNPEFVELLTQIRETALGAYAHQDTPFEKLVEELQPERDMSHSPLFQVAFAFQNIPADQSITIDTLTMQPIQNEGITAKYDLTLTMTETGNSIIGSMEYNTDLFNRSTIERMLGHFKTILEQVTDDPEIRVGSIPLMPKTEALQLLEEWNQTDADFPINQCVHTVFESIAEAHPEAPALIFREHAAATESTTLTYDALNRRANQLARRLLAEEMGAEKVVGICMQRSVEMITAMLATLKAGAAYVPIDPTYPSERITHMVQDSGLTVLLTQESLGNVTEVPGIKTIAVDSEASTLDTMDDSNPGIAVLPENLAYIIYTSGSTGKPKGTLLQHRGAVNLAHIQQQAFQVGTGSKILQFASLSFDAATWEFLMAMLSGSTLVLTAFETITDGQALSDLLAAEKITTVTLPPSVLSVMPKTELPALQTLITAGEAVSPELVAQWSDKRRFFNAYGPTETTVCASMHECQGHYESNPPIGRANPNFRLYIIDAYMNPCPVGVPGELCVAGVGLARGYHNRPALTAEKFIPNPFSSHPGDRLYRTGDLVRYLPDGNIEFLGRIDHQVKIRGFRIELGEIEAALSRHEKVNDQLVLAQKDHSGGKRLVAYAVASDTDATELKNFLRSQLPDYMVPANIVILDAFPLTPNGKINRNALPAPEVSRSDLSAAYVAPRNETEKTLVDIATELLGVEQVGVHDNFFDIGGHSLLATQFMSRLKTATGVELSLKTLFEKPTVAQIAEEVSQAQTEEQPKTDVPKIKRVSRSAKRMKRSDLE